MPDPAPDVLKDVPDPLDPVVAWLAGFLSDWGGEGPALAGAPDTAETAACFLRLHAEAVELAAAALKRSPDAPEVAEQAVDAIDRALRSIAKRPDRLASMRGGQLRAYLRRTLRSQILDRADHLKVVERHRAEQCARQPIAVPALPEELTDAAEIRRALDVLAAEKPHFARVVWAREVDGLTIAAICEAEGLDPSSKTHRDRVSQWRHRGLKRLRQIIEAGRERNDA